MREDVFQQTIGRMGLGIEPFKKKMTWENRKKHVKRAKNLKGACFQKPLEHGCHWALESEGWAQEHEIDKWCVVCLWAFSSAR